MKSKIKNIIIFVVIGAVLTGSYLLFAGKSEKQPSLVGSSGTSTGTNTGNLKKGDSEIAKELLGVLLNVKSIRLEDDIFKEDAFTSLRDSSILLVPDGNEGRPNPFAPIGSDLSASAINASAPTTNTSTPAGGVQSVTPPASTTPPTTATTPVPPVTPAQPTN